MATYYKRNAITTLNTNTAWDSTSPTGAGPAGPPTVTDTAQWDTASQGGGLTGSFGAGTLQYNGSTISVIHSSGTVTVGDINLTSSTKTWTESGTFDVGTGSTLTWTFYGIASAAAGFDMLLNGALTGSSQITLARSGSATNPAIFQCGSTTSTYTGTFILGSNTTFITTSGTAGAGIGSTALIKANSSTATFNSTTGSGIIDTPVEVNANISLQYNSGTSLIFGKSFTLGSGGPYSINFNSNTEILGLFDLSSGSHTVIISSSSLFPKGGISLGSGSIEFQGAGTLSTAGSITGTNGFYKSGSGTIRMVSSGSTLSGNIVIGGGTFELYMNTFPSVPAITINNAKVEFYNSTATCTHTFNGSGNSTLRFWARTSLEASTFNIGALSGFTPSSGGGFQVGSVGISALSLVDQSVLISEFTTRMGFYLTANYLAGFAAGSSATAKIVWNNASSANFTGVLTFEVESDVNTATQVLTASLVNNQANLLHTLSVSGTTENILTLANSGPVTLSLEGSNEGNNEFSAVMNMHLLNLAKVGTGKWIISSSNPFSSTSTTHGNVTIGAGTLTTRNAGAIGAAANPRGVTLSGGTLQLDGADLTRTSGAFSYGGGTLENLSGDNTITAASHTLNANTSFLITAGSLTLAAAITGASTRTLTKSGSGALHLNNTTSGYFGPTTVSAGTLYFKSIENAGVASSLGAPATAQATITLGAATLSFTGTVNKSTTRNISCNAVAGANCALLNDGTAALTYASGGTFAFSVAGTHTLELGGTCTTESTFARTLANSTSAVSLLKSGAGAWLMSGNMTATGNITISGGDFRITGTTTSSSAVTCGGNTANFGSVNRTFSSLNISSGTVSINAGNTISAPTTISGGCTVTAVLAGANTLTVNSNLTEISPAILQPNDSTNGNNTFTGSVSINGYTDLITPALITPLTSGRGRVLGTSNTVTVSSTGVIRTKTGPATNQRGQARYNNLTFQSGSIIQIGKAT